MSRSMGVCLILLVEEGAGGERETAYICVQMAASAERACRIAVPFMPVAPVTIARGIAMFGWLVGIYMFGERYSSSLNSTTWVLCFGGNGTSIYSPTSALNK